MTGCLRKIEKINICMKLAKKAFLVTDENMGLCLYIHECGNIIHEIYSCLFVNISRKKVLF